MLTKESLQQFTKRYQTDSENVVREYCQHLFLSFLYQQPESEKLLFKGGTALRILFQSPRFSEDLDFTGTGIKVSEVEELFTAALVQIEKIGIQVSVTESKHTSGGYLGIAMFSLHTYSVRIHMEVSLRVKKPLKGTRALVHSDFMPAYTLLHLPVEEIIEGKLDALYDRQKPRDFYDYYFLLSGNYPIVKENRHLKKVLLLLKASKLNFRAELKRFLPASQAMQLKEFRSVLEQKIKSYLGA